MFVTIIAISLAATVDIEAAGRASSGDRVVSPSTGVALTVPEGMTAALDGDVVVLQGPNGTGGMVLVDPELTLDGAQAATRQGLALGGAVFQAVGDGQRTGSTYTVSLATPDGSYVGQGYASLATASPLSVVMVGPADAQSTVDATFQDLVGSLGRAPASKASSSSGTWADAVRGRQLRFYDTRGNSSTSARLDLCSDGTAYGTTSSSFHSDAYDVADVSGAGHGASQGTWTVRGSTLTVRWADGSSDSRTLSSGPSEALLLDGERWLRADLENCR